MPTSFEDRLFYALILCTDSTVVGIPPTPPDLVVGLCVILFVDILRALVLRYVELPWLRGGCIPHPIP